MQIIPFQIDADRYNLFVILEDTNIDRIKLYDPAEFETAKLPPEWQARKLNLVLIGYANAEDVIQVRRFVAAGNPHAALEYLSRGFAYRPDQGDNDFPYTREQ